MKKIVWRYRIGLGILLLPLFYINVKDSHDWGDDFAQYLIQTRNIVEGLPQTENGLIQESEDPAFAIEAYPVGLPIILTPVFYFSGLQIFPYCILFSVFLFLTGLLIFEFFRDKTGLGVSMLIALLFCYNASTIDLKKQILSEIPFMFVMMLGLLWVRKTNARTADTADTTDAADHADRNSGKRYDWIITGLLFAFLVSIRLVGVAVVAGYFCYVAFRIIRQKEKRGARNNFKNLIFATTLAIFVFIILNGLLFPVHPGGLLAFYTTAFGNHDVQFSNNVIFYYTVIKYFFPFLGSEISSAWIFLALAGWLISLLKKPGVIEIVFLFYSVLILFYPYAHAGLRFLIPVLPFLIYYVILFIDWVLSFFGEKARRFTILIPLIFLLSYVTPLINVIRARTAIEEGPQQETSKELFAFLKSTPADAVMVFCKARAISLYAGRSSIYPAKNQSNNEIQKIFSRHRNLYLIIAKVPNDNEIYDPILLDYVSTNKDDYKRVWENSIFEIYKQADI